jgi:hypothetical protein
MSDVWWSHHIDTPDKDYAEATVEQFREAGVPVRLEELRLRKVITRPRAGFFAPVGEKAAGVLRGLLFFRMRPRRLCCLEQFRLTQQSKFTMSDSAKDARKEA